MDFKQARKIKIKEFNEHPNKYCAKRKTYEKIAQIISPGMKMLDVGCGPKDLLKNLCKEKDIDYTRTDVQDYGKEDIIVCNIHNLSNKFKEKFDVVLLTHVLEHISSPYIALLEVNKVLKKEGKVFIESPPYDPGHIVNKSHIITLTAQQLEHLFDLTGFGLVYHDNYNLVRAEVYILQKIKEIREEEKKDD